MINTPSGPMTPQEHARTIQDKLDLLIHLAAGGVTPLAPEWRPLPGQLANPIWLATPGTSGGLNVTVETLSDGLTISIRRMDGWQVSRLSLKWGDPS